MSPRIFFLFFLFFCLIRYLISVGSYSGRGKPPMYGDYEAQRHWMEITLNLPIKEWYFNTTNNDLLYWGLDYPPLTAYGSWICGYMYVSLEEMKRFSGNMINPAWMKLYASRGIETCDSKLFMRATVLVSDILIFFPAVFLFITARYKDSKSILLALFFILMQPSLLLIDHGHFQYNCISLGLTIWAIYFIIGDRDLLGSFFFCLALNYKQMSLYHSTPFFFYLIGKNYHAHNKMTFIKNICAIGVVVVATMALCWLPFLLSGRDSVLQVIHRLFPVARGIYEDKVANFWCAVSPFIKLKQFDQSTLVLTSLCFTLLALLPSSVFLLLRPSKDSFLYALTSSALSFFLFSFQVHEKSILLPLLPAALLLLDEPLSLWFVLVATFSMFPLLQRDGQTLSYWVLFILYMIQGYSVLPQDKKVKIAMQISLLGMFVLHGLELFVLPPAHYPDLFPLLWSIYAFVHFALFYLLFTWKQMHLHALKPQQIK